MTTSPAAKAYKSDLDRRPSPAWGRVLWAGLLGGLVGTGLKTIGEMIAPPRAPGVPSPLLNGIKIVGFHVTGQELDESTQKALEPAVHWIFGTVAGVVYALLAEKEEWVTLGRGAAFGFAFWLLAHETILPLMGWSPPPTQMTFWEQGNEMVTHVMYGVAVELVRRSVRRRS